MRLFVVNVLNSQEVHIVLYSQNDLVVYTLYGIEIIKDNIINNKIIK